jgi:hypothetical protein
MRRRTWIPILVVLGLMSGSAETLAGQSVERVQDPSAQPSKEFRVDRVWVGEELVQKASARTTLGTPAANESVRPLPGSMFVMVGFVLLVKEATTSPVLVDSTGTRYMPVGVSPFSETVYQFFVPTVTGLSKVLAGTKVSRSPGGEVEVTRDGTTGQLTIRVAEPGEKFTAVWTVPQEVLLRSSEFKLYVGPADPLVIHVPYRR